MTLPMIICQRFHSLKLRLDIFQFQIKTDFLTISIDLIHDLFVNIWSVCDWFLGSTALLFSPVTNIQPLISVKWLLSAFIFAPFSDERPSVPWFVYCPRMTQLDGSLLKKKWTLFNFTKLQINRKFEKNMLSNLM